MKEHIVPQEKSHTKWDRFLPPAIEIDPGDIVHFDAREVAYDQIAPKPTAEMMRSLDLERAVQIYGPVYVKDAKPGDVLSVEVLETKIGSWGYTPIFPGSIGFGLLAEDFPDPYVQVWDLSDGKTTKLRPNIFIPLDPFCGTMGVAPAEEKLLDLMPPLPCGGNVDHRHLHQGSTLLIPVQVEGALFSAGDCHAAQGDGEVCGAAIEAPMKFSLRLNVRRDISIQGPQFICPGPLTSKFDAKGYYGTMGIGPDLRENAKKAIRYMIEYLVTNYGLTREEAYVLCSVAADLKINEIIDAPNWIVSAYIPLSIFAD